MCVIDTCEHKGPQLSGSCWSKVRHMLDMSPIYRVAATKSQQATPQLLPPCLLSVAVMSLAAAEAITRLTSFNDCFPSHRVESRSQPDKTEACSPCCVCCQGSAAVPADGGGRRGADTESDARLSGQVLVPILVSVCPSFLSQ